MLYISCLSASNIVCVVATSASHSKTTSKLIHSFGLWENWGWTLSCRSGCSWRSVHREDHHRHGSFQPATNHLCTQQSHQQGRVHGRAVLQAHRGTIRQVQLLLPTHSVPSRTIWDCKIMASYGITRQQVLNYLAFLYYRLGFRSGLGNYFYIRATLGSKIW